MASWVDIAKLPPVSKTGLAHHTLILIVGPCHHHKLEILKYLDKSKYLLINDDLISVHIGLSKMNNLVIVDTNGSKTARDRIITAGLVNDYQVQLVIVEIEPYVSQISDKRYEGVDVKEIEGHSRSNKFKDILISSLSTLPYTAKLINLSLTY